METDNPLAIGYYRWWVRGFTAAGAAGSWSSSQDFATGGKPSLLNVPATTSNRTPTFTWTAVQGAARYEIWIAKADVNVVVLNVRNITTNSFTPSSDLAAQGYRVWVRAISTTGTVSAWSSSVTFTVTDLEPDSPLGSVKAELFVIERPREKNGRFPVPADRPEACGPIAAEPSMEEISRQAIVVADSQFPNDPEVDIDRVMTEWAIQG